MENNIVTAEVIEQQCFLTSEKRLFNRRGSNETSESDDASKPASLNINAPIFVPKSKTAKPSEDEQSASPNQQRKRAKSKRRNKLSFRNCSYCQRKGYDAIMASTHTMRNPQTSEIICPFLLKDICTVHPDSQDAHDRFECPLLGFRPFEIDFKL